MDYETEIQRLKQALKQSDHIRSQWQVAIQELKKTQSRLKQAQENLEAKVAERTAELESSNKALKAEIEHRKEVELSMRKLSYAIEKTGSIVIITDRDGVIEYVNPRFTEVTGYTSGEVKGMNPRILKSGKTSINTYREMWDAVLAGRHWRGEILNRRKAGAAYWAYLTVSPIEDEAGNILHLVGVSEDVTELKSHIRMAHMALFDVLTELPNRRNLTEHLGQALKASQRSGKRLALMFLDLDNFKHINDTLGHSLGDQLLKTVAKRLCAVLREDDIVARFGGDEFVILLKEVDGPIDAKLIAQKIMSGVCKPINLNGRKVCSSTSVGITLAPQDGMDPETLMRNADLAMYSAKDKGRNNYQFFTEVMNREVTERATTEKELTQAAVANQFRLYLQPVLSINDFRTVSAEALIRWQHPEKGLMMPGSFISIAEETGQIVQIGEWVIREACRIAFDLRKRGHEQVSVAINVSPRQFTEAGFTSIVRRILSETGVSGYALNLEITELTLMRDIDLVIETLDCLKRMGISISVDDFGTGYSSLSYLKRLPVDVVKIDRSFVRDIPVDPDSAGITEAIIAMAKKLRMKVVAEGVATRKQLDFLLDAGCDMVQGYLLGRPEPANVLFNRLDHSPWPLSSEYDKPTSNPHASC